VVGLQTTRQSETGLPADGVTSAAGQGRRAKSLYGCITVRSLERDSVHFDNGKRRAVPGVLW